MALITRFARLFTADVHAVLDRLPARYGDEESSLQPIRVAPEFLVKHLVNFGKRLFYNYFLRSFSIASVNLVLGTLHTSDSVGAIPRLRSLGLSDHEIADSLLLVIAIPLALWILRGRLGRGPLVALLCFSGLRAIPDAYYQAAKIDGASGWAVFRYIQLPKLKWVLTIAVLLRFMDSFMIYTEPFVLTGGGPGNSTTFLSIDLVKIALGQFDLGPAAAGGAMDALGPQGLPLVLGAGFLVLAAGLLIAGSASIAAGPREAGTETAAGASASTTFACRPASNR